MLGLALIFYLNLSIPFVIRVAWAHNLLGKVQIKRRKPKEYTNSYFLLTDLSCVTALPRLTDMIRVAWAHNLLGKVQIKR